MLTALLLLAIFFGLVQEVKISKLKAVPFGYKGKRAKRSALVSIPEKSKA
jgi:hypothetical protein